MDNGIGAACVYVGLDARSEFRVCIGAWACAGHCLITRVGIGVGIRVGVGVSVRGYVCFGIGAGAR